MSVGCWKPFRERPSLNDVAQVIWETSRRDEGTISATGANIVAAAVMSLFDVVRSEAEIKAEALEEAANRENSKKCERCGHLSRSHRWYSRCMGSLNQPDCICERTPSDVEGLS